MMVMTVKGDNCLSAICYDKLYTFTVMSIIAYVHSKSERLLL